MSCLNCKLHVTKPINDNCNICMEYNQVIKCQKCKFGICGCCIISIFVINNLNDIKNNNIKNNACFNYYEKLFEKFKKIQGTIIQIFDQ